MRRAYQRGTGFGFRRMGSAGADKVPVSDKVFDSDDVSNPDDSDKASISDDKTFDSDDVSEPKDSDKASISDDTVFDSDKPTSTTADWAFFVDTPVCEFPAVGGV